MGDMYANGDDRSFISMITHESITLAFDLGILFSLWGACIPSLSISVL